MLIFSTSFVDEKINMVKAFHLPPIRGAFIGDRALLGLLVDFRHLAASSLRSELGSALLSNDRWKWWLKPKNDRGRVFAAPI
jgi:hypothetical protein